MVKSLTQALHARNGVSMDITANSVEMFDDNGDDFSSGIFSIVNSTGQGGRITIDTTIFESVGAAFILVDTLSSGQGGNLIINTDSFSLQNSSQIVVSSDGDGDGGDLTINANTIELIGTKVEEPLGVSGLFTSASDSGNSGDMILETDSLSLRDISVMFSGNYPGAT